jgi:hypothetical protein
MEARKVTISEVVSEAVRENDLEAVRKFLEDGYDPDARFSGLPLLFLATTSDMVLLLKEFGADPNAENTGYGETHILDYLLMPQTICAEAMNIIMALVIHHCTIHNKNINKAIIKLSNIMKDPRQLLYLSWSDQDTTNLKNALSYLLLASSDLFENSRLEEGSPFDYCMNVEDIALFEMMLEHNSAFWNILQSVNFNLLSLPSAKRLSDSKRKEFQGCINEHAVTKYLKIYEIFRLFNWCPVEIFPLDVARTIQLCLLSTLDKSVMSKCESDIKNKHWLADKADTFKITYTLLKEQTHGRHTLLEELQKNNISSPSNILLKAREYASASKGITRKALHFAYYFDEEKLVSECVKNQMFLFTVGQKETAKNDCRARLKELMGEKSSLRK